MSLWRTAGLPTGAWPLAYRRLSAGEFALAPTMNGRLDNEAPSRLTRADLEVGGTPERTRHLEWRWRLRRGLAG